MRAIRVETYLREGLVGLHNQFNTNIIPRFAFVKCNLSSPQNSFPASGMPTSSRHFFLNKIPLNWEAPLQLAPGETWPDRRAPYRVLLMNAIRLLSGDQLGTLIVPCPPYTYAIVLGTPPAAGIRRM